MPEDLRRDCRCGHPLKVHAAQEGMCLGCECFGWEPQPKTGYANETTANPERRNNGCMIYRGH